MTDQEWMECDDPKAMFKLLGGGASDRKFRLFASACCRRIWHLLTDEALRNAVETAEKYADNLVDAEALDQIHKTIYPGVNTSFTDEDIRRLPAVMATRRATSIWQTGVIPMDHFAYNAGSAVIALAHSGALSSQRKHLRRSNKEWRKERLRQGNLVRCIFGNPLRPVALDAKSLTATVRQLAQAIYDDKDFAKLPLLADLLEESGCDEEDILKHLRSGGEHVRGCWVLDMVLGKE